MTTIRKWARSGALAGIRTRAWRRVILGVGVGAACALSACGGGDAALAAAPATPGGGLYVGYYQEDPVTNPEDPTPGAFSLNLPAANGTFSGSMFFTYVGCQTSNVGVVSGSKTDLALSGNWSGTIDGLAESGTYAGTYDATAGVYTGTYLNAAGKQFRDLRPCIQYTIAPNGVFEMFSIESHVPSTFSVAVAPATRTITWGAVSGAATTLVYVLDPAIATSSGNPVLWQTVLAAGVTATVPSTVALVSGRPYIAVVGVLNSSFKRIAFSSLRFNAP